MGINRLTNLNIRDVPGNGSIVGPSTSPSLGISTTTCEYCTNSIGGCADYSLGSQYVSFCACACCDIVCGCYCTVCDRTVPSGMWKTSEQYEAKERDAWGDDTSSSGPETCLCNINLGYVGCTCSTFTGGYVICKASNVAWVVAPMSAEVSRNWFSRNDAITTAQSISGCTGWFIPTGDNTSTGQLYNPGYLCRTYWDNYSLNCYWADTDYTPGLAWVVNFNNGGQPGWFKPSTFCVRAFRCVAY